MVVHGYHEAKHLWFLINMNVLTIFGATGLIIFLKLATIIVSLSWILCFVFIVNDSLTVMNSFHSALPPPSSRSPPPPLVNQYERIFYIGTQGDINTRPYVLLKAPLLNCNAFHSRYGATEFVKYNTAARGSKKQRKQNLRENE